MGGKGRNGGRKFTEVTQAVFLGKWNAHHITECLITEISVQLSHAESD